MRATMVVLTGPPGAGKSTLAEAVAARIGGACVLGWDWAMAGTTWCAPVVEAVGGLDRVTRHRLGWSIIANLAEEQLRAGRSVVLDGVSTPESLDVPRAAARRAGCRLGVVALHCSDVARHRHRIEQRERGIPGWYELTWEQVARSRAAWTTPPDVDVVIDTADDPDPAELAARIL